MHADQTVRGTIAEGALAPLLGRLQRARATGWLRMSRMEVRGGVPSVTRLGLRLQGGRVLGVDGDAGAADGAASRAGADLSERATAGLAFVLASPDAVHRWEGDASGGPGEPSAPWLAALVLRAVDRLEDAAVRDALGDPERVLRREATDEVALSLLTSGPRALLPRLLAEPAAAALIADGGDPVARDLLLLVGAGLVDWTPAAPLRPPAATPAPRPAVPAATPTPVKEAPAPGPDALVARREIEAAHAALRGANRFEILGLTPEASTDEVRQAFARLARRYHPDAQRDASLQDLRPRLTDLFVAVNDAHAILKDASARARYERTLPSMRRAIATASAPRRGETVPAAVPSSHRTDAADQPLESRLLRAQECLDARQPWEAIRLLEEALPAAAGGLKVRAQVLLGRAYADRERPHEAEKVLLEAVQADPGCLSACVLLGRLFRERGMVKRARAYLERALEIDPGQAEARRELAALGEPPPAAGPPSLLSRLRDRR